MGEIQESLALGDLIDMILKFVLLLLLFAGCCFSCDEILIFKNNKNLLK